MFTDGKNLEKMYFEHFKWFHEWFLKKKKKKFECKTSHFSCRSLVHCEGVWDGGGSCSKTVRDLRVFVSVHDRCPACQKSIYCVLSQSHTN